MIYLRVTCLLIGSFFLFTFFPLMFVKSRNFGLLASFSFRSFASKHTLSVFRKCFRQLKVIPAAIHLIHNISSQIKTSESKTMNHRNEHLCYHSIILYRIFLSFKETHRLKLHIDHRLVQLQLLTFQGRRLLEITVEHCNTCLIEQLLL